jgi:hypothetical protein
MIQIKRFIDKVAGCRGASLILSIEDAKSLRDEVSKLLADLHEGSDSQKGVSDNIEVQIVGGKFK